MQINESGCIKLEVFDVAGKLVGIKEETFTPGKAKMQYAVEALQPGMYMYRLTLKNQTQSGKLIISDF